MAKKPQIQIPIQNPVGQQFNAALPSTNNRRDNPKGKSRTTILTVAGVIFALLLVGVVMFLQTRYFKAQEDGYKEGYVESVEVKHEVVGEGKNSPIPNVESLITPKAKAELNNGKGIEVKLISTYKGKEDSVQTFVIEPWKSFEETSVAARQRLVNAKLSELQTKLNEFGTYAPREWNFVLILDDTEGVDKRLKEKFQIVFNELLIDERVKQGDGVTLNFAKLSNTQLSQEAPKVVIPKGSGSLEAFQSQLATGREWILQAKSESQSSSVYPGLLNILGDYAKQDRTRVVIISDMMENDLNGSGVSFYKDEGKKLLADESQWEQLDGKLKANQKPVDLKGLWIKIYAPPSVAKFSKVAKDAQNYAEHFLRGFGAEVETKF